jgi:hypothetical protein
MHDHVTDYDELRLMSINPPHGSGERSSIGTRTDADAFHLGFDPGRK